MRTSSRTRSTVALGALLLATWLSSDRTSAASPDLDAVVRALRAAFAPTTAPDHRCLTVLLERGRRERDRLPEDLRVELDRWLNPREGVDGGDPWYTFVSPLGLFSLHYATSGPDSVPDADVDPADGVPDFVQRCADYADFSWIREVDSLGFTAPLLPPDGTYDITFLALPPVYYGYAVVSGATTEIVLHRNFVSGFGWPPNDDPDGDQLGRAKVTIAHEFKHASQYTNNGWTEWTWAELDAVWVEDIVYPVVNDYKYFLVNGSNSQLDAPWVRLDDDSGFGNYEDCLWEHWMSGQWGPDVIRELWERRAQHPSEDMTTSYRTTLEDRGTTWRDAYAGYLEWCWFTGSRAESAFGFPDSPSYWRMELVEPPVGSYPHTAVDTVDRFAGHPRRFNRGTATGSPRIQFDGADEETSLVVSVIAKRTDGSFWIERPPLQPGNVMDHTIREPWLGLYYVGVLVTNGDPAGSAAPYSLGVLDEPVATDVPAGAGPGMRLDARPNPAPGRTRFAYVLGRTGKAEIRLVDVAGRTIRTLALPPRSATGEVGWDGRDSAGRPAAAGVYWAVLENGTGALTRRVVLVR